MADIKRNNTLTPEDVRVADLDHRADFAETNTEAPDFIRNKPEIPEVSDMTMVFKSFVTGVLTVTIGEDDYTLQVTEGALAWAKVTS